MSIQHNSADDKRQYDEPGFEVNSPCGRTWFVPLAAVRNDYAAFVRQVDGLDEAASLEKAQANAQFIPTWFAEQFDWDDVERCGRLVQSADEARVKRALDFFRDNAGDAPSTSSRVVGVIV